MFIQLKLIKLKVHSIIHFIINNYDVIFITFTVIVITIIIVWSVIVIDFEFDLFVVDRMVKLMVLLIVD